MPQNDFIKVFLAQIFYFIQKNLLSIADMMVRSKQVPAQTVHHNIGQHRLETGTTISYFI